ncbi:hypothetical protein I4U23_000281 [Adineta vaga]|nr:hypothetical protein I4U23_000281 [Adineta vaga]
MKHSSVEFHDLPDEILLIILKKLNNIQVLYSLVRVNKRFNRLVHDSYFTSNLSLLRRFTDYSIVSLPDSILDRFCLQILKEIHQNIRWLNLESLSMKHILLAANYPNLFGLGLYNIEAETELSLCTDEFQLIPINKSQISALVIDVFKCEETKRFNSNLITRIFMNIFTMFSNLQYLNYCSSSIYNGRFLFINLKPNINSSTLVELHICLSWFCDCLYMLDGRFNNLQTFYVDIECISSVYMNNHKQKKLPYLKCFSLSCGMGTRFYDELILPLLQRINTFIDGNELNENMINHMLQLKRFELYICSGFHRDNHIYLPTKEDIQYTFKDFKDGQIISYVDYFQKELYHLCHIFSYPDQTK